ncbi:hypothetical protein RISK_005050 [Rhodopirellula islandica]|uniref:Uncharacterized protein n=1 Tax=Rhodopirellula islandica TaxID=595434 RepID=A0A0J1EAX5_RHOIS|nr:hypothetical protein RISK_005050 [Rhodopirellula islandica]
MFARTQGLVPITSTSTASLSTSFLDAGTSLITGRRRGSFHCQTT